MKELLRKLNQQIKDKNRSKAIHYLNQLRDVANEMSANENAKTGSVLTYYGWKLEEVRAMN